MAKELAKQGVDLRIHSVGYQVDGKARLQLTCIAQATGGTYTNVPDAAGLGRALTRVTASALRNYQAAGTPVTGADEIYKGPVLTPGSYLDTLGFAKKRYYTVELKDGETGYLAATGIFERGSSHQSESINVRLYGHDGEDCNRFENKQTTRAWEGESITATMVWIATTDTQELKPGCATPGRYILAIYFQNNLGRQDDPNDRVPIEIQVGVEPPVNGDKGPEPVTDPVAFTDPGGTEQPVAGGGSFGTAATLPGSGRYVEQLRYSEILYYRVRLEWGQALAYQVRYGEGQIGRYSNAQTELYSPSRAELAHDDSVTSGHPSVLPQPGKTLSTVPIRYRNRELDRLRHETPWLTSVPGWYYISVKLAAGQTMAGDSADDQPPVPIEVAVSVTGTPEKGLQYADTSRTDAFAGASPFPAASPSDGPLMAKRASDQRSPLWWAVAGVGVMAGVGVAVAAAIGTILVLRRRRGVGQDTGVQR